jgi:hypothetical protein
MSGVIPGNYYTFRVKAKYQNGYTAYSEESSPIWACRAPSSLAPIQLIAVTRAQMTFQWS